MDENLINFERWKAAGTPDGYVWGVTFDYAYPGATYTTESPRAPAWKDAPKFGKFDDAVNASLVAGGVAKDNNVLIKMNEMSGLCGQVHCASNIVRAAPPK
jgi:hypothetical protein